MFFEGGLRQLHVARINGIGGATRNCSGNDYGAIGDFGALSLL